MFLCLQSELINQSFFELIHPHDIDKVKEQLASNDYVPKERYIDSKTMQLIRGTRPPPPPAHLQLRSGGRRQFICRIRQHPDAGASGESAVATTSAPAAAATATCTTSPSLGMDASADLDAARMRGGKRKAGW